MCITNPLKISDFQGNLLHMLLFSQKHAFYFSILRIKEGLSHVQQPLLFCVGEGFIPPVEWMAAAHFPGAVKTAPYKAPVNGTP